MNNNAPTGLPEELSVRFEGLKASIASHGPMAVAYSGGVDSAFLAYAAREALGDEMICVIAVSPSLGEREYHKAVAFLRDHQIPFEEVRTAEMDDERYRANGPDRCYFCKSELFNAIAAAESLRRFPCVAYGANVDDSGDYRPGARAASEHEIVAPLTEAGYGKKLIRDTARRLGLDVWDKPAAPCLASRVPYFSEVTPAKLVQIESAEAVLKDAGFRECRVRHHGDTARIEVPAADVVRLHEAPVWTVVERGIRGAGFDRVEIEAEGLRSGRLNDALGNTDAGG